jgi:hypothetical protein
MANDKKSELLGLNYSTAASALRKQIIFHLAGVLDLRECYRCGTMITIVEQFSIEHKDPWMGAEDPKAAFFDVSNIAFSHLSCNRPERERAETCKRGHPVPSTRGTCLPCKKISDSSRKRSSNYREYNQTYQRNYWQDPERKEWNRQRSRQDYIKKNLDA